METEEERPSPTAYTPITPPDEEQTVATSDSIRQTSEQPGSRRPVTMLTIGFVLVAALIVAGLFLPPISLGERLAGGDPTDEPQTAVVEKPAAPDGITISSASPLPDEAVASFSPVQFSADENWSAVAAALPEGLTLKSTVFTIELGEASVTGQLALRIPDDAGSFENLDLYGWDGGDWQFIPSQINAPAQELVSPAVALPRAVAIALVDAPQVATISVEVLPTQTLPSEILPEIAEIIAGTLTLSGDGALSGEISAVPASSLTKLLRVTNTGAIVDQVSLSQFLNDAQAQSDQVGVLLGQVLSMDFSGVYLDYQGVPAELSGSFTSFVATLADALHGQGRTLGVALGMPDRVNNEWLPVGQEWAALGQIADAIYVQMPLDPLGYADGGIADQLLLWATRQVPRQKITALHSASAIDRIGESFLQLPNDQALQNFGELRFVQGAGELEPDSAVEVALSGTAGPLEWDGASLTYRYSYELAGQSHHVWLASEAALSHQLRFAQRYNTRGIAVRGLGSVEEGTGYAAAFANFAGRAEAPQPVGAAIVWTVRTEEGSVVASSSGDTLTFSWAGTDQPGTYNINAEFAMGESVASLGSLEVAILAPPEPEPVAEEPEEVAAADEEETPVPAETTPEATAPPPVSPGDADAVVNVGANIRVGPGLGYGTIAGGLERGTRVKILGRNSDASWLQILMPDGTTKGWIFATLLDINGSVDVGGLEVVQVDPPVVADGGGGGGGNTAPPPVTVPPVTNTGFELGGQTHTLANPTLMSYSGMRWVKFQHKWSAGDSPDAVAGRIQQAHANGFKVLLSIPGTDHSSIDFNAYTSFLGGVAALGPNAIEVWNEMNIDREWPAGQISPSTYVNNMLAPAYNAIKAANASVMVISGAPAPTGFFGGCGGGGCNDDLYVAGMAAAGAARYMDCIGIHYNEGIISPNQTSGDPRNPSNHYTRYFWGMVNTYWNAFGGARPLCFTELGYLSGADYGGLPGGFAWAGSTSIAQHAQWLAEAASLSASSGKVRMMIVFNVDFTTFGADPQAGYAMMRADGSCPACETLRQVMGGG